MKQHLLSVGIDVGTTTTQLVFSRLLLRNEAAAFAVPKIRIAEKQIVYRSAVHFTPLLSETVIDTARLREIVEAEYRRAEKQRADVDTGAVIITGETARRENASAVLRALSGLAGDFVVATAGPQLESILAGRGSGAQARSDALRASVLNLDIGGGTTNLAHFSCGALTDTGCLNLGGRLLCYDEDKRLTYRSPVLRGYCDFAVGDRVSEAALRSLAEQLAHLVLEAVGLFPKSPQFSHFITDKTIGPLPEDTILSFSGGVGALLDEPDTAWDCYGDLGVLLARALLRLLPRNIRRLQSPEAIRATVIGAACHTTELSGSTVYHRGISFPLQSLPVLHLTQGMLERAPEQLAAQVRQHETRYGSVCALALEGLKSPSYAALAALADRLAPLLHADAPNILVLREDMAKALGQALAVRRADAPLLCLDGIDPPPDTYLDVGVPVADGQAVPVVIKTLIL